jgi:hypothetical protein
MTKRDEQKFDVDNVSCEGCRFAKWHDGFSWTCRREPPKPLSVDYDPDGSNKRLSWVRWPIVMPEDCCGAYEPAGAAD